MVARRAVALGAVVALAALGACSNVLGLKDLEPYPAEGGAEAGPDAGGESGGDDGTSPGADAGDAHAPDGTGGSDSAPGADSTTDASTADSSTGDATGTDSSSQDSGTVDAVTVDVVALDVSTADVQVGCEAGQTSCSGQCVDTQADGHNCGTCGHDCLAGDSTHCVGGVCQPVLLASSVSVYDLAVVHPTASTTSLYWVDQSPTTGGSRAWSCTVAASPAACPASAISTGGVTMTATERIAFDGTGTIFWTEYGTGTSSDGRVWEYPIGGTASTLASGLAQPEGIAADGAYAYWVQGGTTPSLDQYSRSAHTATAYPLGTGSNGGGLALGSSVVVWADWGRQVVGKCIEGACTPASFASSPVPWSVAIDSTYVYWTDFESAGSVWRADIATTTPAQLGGTEANPIRIAVDGQGIFWTDNGTTASNGALAACTALGTGCTHIAGSLAAPVGLAIDAKAIYYGTTGDSRLWLLAR